MEHVEKAKLYFTALVFSFVSPLPLKIAVTLVVVVFASGLLSMIATWRRGGRVSPHRATMMLLRALAYVVFFPALYYVTGVLDVLFLWNSVVYLIAAHELGLLLQELYDSGLLPQWLVDKIQKLFKDVFRDDRAGG